MKRLWIKVGLWGIFLPLSATALAENAPVCGGYAAIPKPQNCDDNEQIGKEALRCTRNYFHFVQASQRKILENFQKEIAQMKEQQTDTFNRTKTGYDKTREKLLALIEDGKAVRLQVDNLAANLFFPEDYDQPNVTGMSKEKYLATEDCYAVPTRVLNQSKQMLDKIMSDLTAVEKTAFGKQNISQYNSSDLQNISPEQIGAKAPNSANGEGNPTGFRKPSSDISEADDSSTSKSKKKSSKKKKK